MTGKSSCKAGAVFFSYLRQAVNQYFTAVLSQLFNTAKLLFSGSSNHSVFKRRHRKLEICLQNHWAASYSWLPSRSPECYSSPVAFIPPGCSQRIWCKCSLDLALQLVQLWTPPTTVKQETQLNGKCNSDCGSRGDIFSLIFFYWYPSEKDSKNQLLSFIS